MCHSSPALLFLSGHLSNGWWENNFFTQMSPLNPALSQRKKKNTSGVCLSVPSFQTHKPTLSGQGLAAVRRGLLTPAQSPAVCRSGGRREVSGGNSPGHCVPNVYTRVECRAVWWVLLLNLKVTWGKVLGLPLTHVDRLMAIVQTKQSPASKESTTIPEDMVILEERLDPWDW